MKERNPIASAALSLIIVFGAIRLVFQAVHVLMEGTPSHIDTAELKSDIEAMDMIEEIDHALTKFDLGTYGICEVSGEPIPEERLEAIPWAREKVEYKVGGFGRR